MKKLTASKDRKIILSTLWIFVTLNYIYCDILSLMDHTLLSQFLTGSVDGITITPQFLFLGAILMEIPIALVLLSRILKYRANRWANIIGAVIKTAAMIATFFTGAPSAYYLFFGTIEIACTIFIIWYAWTWSNKES